MHRFAKVALIAIIFVLNFTYVGTVYSGEQGHYSAMSLGVRDTTMPPKGVYVAGYNMYYSSDTMKDGDGNKLDSFSSSGTATRDFSIHGESLPVTITGTLNANMDVELDTFNQLIAFIWAPGNKILGADYAFMILPSWGYTSVDVEVTADAAGSVTVGGVTKTFAANTTVKVHDEDTGFGDLYVQPIWLNWRINNCDLGISYGVWCPTGFYDKDNIANVGFGFVTQQVQATAYYYPFKNHGTALMVRPTYEYNHEKIDKDVQPGQDIILEYGVVHAFDPRFEVGVSGYNAWQISDDSGEAAIANGTLDRVNGVGANVTYWVLPHKLSVTGKFNQEYGAEDRFEGTAWSLNFLYIW